MGTPDLHGNVWERRLDWYAAEYYRESAPVDPAGPATGTVRVLRGSICPYRARWVRSAARSRLAHSYRDSDIGARLVRTGP